MSESGQVAVANRTSITTQASGVISEVNVKNGDTVALGQQIAVISLDQSGQQRQAQAWASYLSAKSSLGNANAQLYSLQSTMYSKWKTYMDISQNSTYQNSDGSPCLWEMIFPCSLYTPLTLELKVRMITRQLALVAEDFYPPEFYAVKIRRDSWGHPKQCFLTFF